MLKEQMLPVSGRLTSNIGSLTLNGLSSSYNVQQTLCLVCNDTNNTFKRSNLKGHFHTKHADQRKTEDACLQSRLDQHLSSRSRPQKFLRLLRVALVPPMKVLLSLLIAMKMHPFADADFVMDCILAAAGVICPEQHCDSTSGGLGF